MRKIRYGIRCSLLVLFFFGLALPFVHLVYAEGENGYLPHNGKMDLKTDRLQQTEEKKNKLQEKKQVETEFDKQGVPLFTSELQKKVESQKQAEEAVLKEIKHNLFSAGNKTTATLTAAKNELFNEDYSSEAMVAKETIDQNKKEDGTKETMIGIIAGSIVALCAGMYVAVRNVWE